MKKIYYTKPSISELEIQYADDAVRNGWGEKCYDYINIFEKKFSEYLGVKYSIATSSCTGAIHMGLSAIGVGSGDEVILADINWIASAAPVTYLGAEPVFVDILPDTWCIDPAKIEEAVTSRTKAIIAVHLYGNLCEMDEIMRIANKYNLYVIEDAAEAIGSVYKGRRAGSIGDFGVFSFHGTKTMTTGEGGMFVTNNKDLYDKIIILNNHGRDSKIGKQFWCEIVGFKYKISNVQAAIGVAQLERINELVQKKRDIFYFYKKELEDLDCIQLNIEIENTINCFWMPSIIFDKSLNLDRDNLIYELQNNNIDGRVFFYPLSSMPMFKKNFNNSVSYDIFYRAINLPTYYDLEKDDIKRVIKIIKDFIKKK